MLEDEKAISFAQHMALTYMSDETYVQTALMNSPRMRQSLVNHNLRYIDWPHGYGDPSAYWRAVGLKHASGPMVLSLELLPRVLSSAAAFARKVDLELPEGVGFVEAWDAWMATKMDQPSEPEAEPRHGHGQPEQLALASDLLVASAALALGTPPLATEVKRLEAEGLAAAEVLARYPPRQVHYGHEDVMMQQFERPPLPHDTPALTPLFAPKLGGAESEAAQRVAAEVAAEVAAAFASAAVQPPPQLTRIVFEDGSSCSCEPSCAEAHECCDDYPEACSGTAFGSSGWW